MFRKKEDNKIVIERERERERVKSRRFEFLFTVFIVSAVLVFSPVFVSASGEISPSRSILASIGSFFKGLVFSSGNQADDQNENNGNIITYDKAEFEKQLQQQKQDIEEALIFAKRAEAKYNSLQTELNNIKASGLKIEGRTIENKTTEKTIEKIVSGLSQADLDSGLSNLRTELNNLNTNLLNQINTLSASSNRQTSAVYQAVSLTNKIDSLSGTRLSNITVSGVSGLADSDIPDGITVSNYLPLAGGTLTGNILLPASAYLNFGTDSGATGYGFRDNGGTIQVKNSAGSWSNIPTSGATQWTTAGDDIYYTAGNIGIGTTSPYAKLSVVGETVSSYFTATTTTASTFPYASTTALTVSGSAYIGSLNGPLQANNGLVSATTSVGYQYGGTGLTDTPSFGQILRGTGTGYALTATSTLGINTNDLIEGSNLFWTNNRFDNRLSATTTLPNLTTLVNLSITGSQVSNLNTLWDTRFAATSTTGLAEGTNQYYTQDRVAGVIAGTTTDALAQGSTNKYWSNTLFDNRLSATTTLPNLTTLANLSVTGSQVSNLNTLWDNRMSATTTLPNITTLANLATLGTITSGIWNGTAIGDSYLTKSGDWTGTLDTYEASSLLARANHTGTQGVATLSNYDWTFSNNYGTNNLTGSSTKPIWAQGGINASSTSNFVYASTTALTVSGSAYIGSLNGPLQANNGLVSATTSVGSIYGGTGLDSSALTGIAQIVSGTWSASSTLSTAFGGTGWNSIQSNSILLGNGAGRLATTTAGTDGYVLALSAGVPTWLATSTLSTITGTLSVAKGGTGQTSFGQGWLHSDGTTLTSSTSPTVAYITATSTTATSTFPYLRILTNSNLGTVIGGTWNGTAVGDAYLTKSGDWTGTLDTYNGSDLLARANHTGTQGVATLSNYDWTFSNNYGTSNLTGSSTKPIWAQGGINASSTSNFVYASTTALTVSGNSYLGTISSGTWNGTAIGNSYLDDDITLTNLTQITNRAITDTTGTLTVARGGTGQTSFGQGWLHSDGTTFTASTSPTVAWLTATSTTATSTFAGGMSVAGSSGLTVLQNGNVGIGTTTPSVPLHLNNTGSNPSQIYLESTATGYNNIMFREAGALTSLIQHVNSNYTSVSERNLLEIDNRATGGAIVFNINSAEKMRVANSGNIGIGTTTPWSLLSLKGSSGAQMTIAQADTNYTQLTVDASGNLTLTPSGSTITIPDDNLKVCAGDACQTTALNSGNGNLTVENNIEIGGNYNRTCAAGYIWVPGSAKFGTLPGFCVMKYEAKNDGSGNAVSTATGGPYVSIDQPTSRTKCEAIGLGYHLISELEWMTIAENIAQTPINDMDDDAGLQLATGHSDNAPASALAATSASDPIVSGCNLSATMENAANAYSASSCEIQGDGSYAGDDNDKGFYGTSQAWATTGYSAGTANKSQLRAHILSNGNVIWDIAGNVWEWTDAYLHTAELPSTSDGTWKEWTAITDYKTLNYARPQNPSWTSSNGIGQYIGTTGATRAFIRGGYWINGAADGVFTLDLSNAPSYTRTYVGFRCSR